jgi:hypothetical protein
MSTYSVHDHYEPDDFASGAASRERCTWDGGGVAGPCPRQPVAKVVEHRPGGRIRRWSACERGVELVRAARAV